MLGHGSSSQPFLCCYPWRDTSKSLTAWTHRLLSLFLADPFDLTWMVLHSQGQPLQTTARFWVRKWVPKFFHSIYCLVCDSVNAPGVHSSSLRTEVFFQMGLLLLLSAACTFSMFGKPRLSWRVISIFLRPRGFQVPFRTNRLILFRLKKKSLESSAFYRWEHQSHETT